MTDRISDETLSHLEDIAAMRTNVSALDCSAVMMWLPQLLAEIRELRKEAEKRDYEPPTYMIHIVCGKQCYRGATKMPGEPMRHYWVCPAHCECPPDELLTVEAWIEQLTKERDLARYTARQFFQALYARSDTDLIDLDEIAKRQPWLRERP